MRNQQHSSPESQQVQRYRPVSPMRTTRSAAYPLTIIIVTSLAIFALVDLLYSDMTFLRRAKGFLRSQTEEWDVGLAAADQGLERSIYWKADFGAGVEVTKNFYHELGNHGYVSHTKAQVVSNNDTTYVQLGQQRGAKLCCISKKLIPRNERRRKRNRSPHHARHHRQLPTRQIQSLHLRPPLLAPPPLPSPRRSDGSNNRTRRSGNMARLLAPPSGSLLMADRWGNRYHGIVEWGSG